MDKSYYTLYVSMLKYECFGTISPHVTQIFSNGDGELTALKIYTILKLIQI